MNPNLCRAAALVVSTMGAATALALNYDVNYVTTPPVVDGNVDSAWSSASPAATGFVKHDTLELSNEQTSVRVLYDDTHLYLLYEATDGAIVPSATANDTGFLFNAVDDAEFFFDPSWRQDGTQNDKMYHIVVDPAPEAYTYTEAGQNDTAWNLSSASQVAFAADGTNWRVEAAIAFDDFNSTYTNSPGRLYGAPRHNAIWGVEFGRIHSMDATPNNAAYTRWNPVSGGFRQRPFSTLSFKGGPGAAKVDLSTGTVTYSTGFESPTFSAGTTVSGIEDFLSANPEVFIASTTEKLSGSQALQMGAGTAGRTLNQVAHSTSVVNPQYMQYALRLPSEQLIEGSYRHVLYLQGAYSSGSALDAPGQIWFYNNAASGSNNVGVVSYQNAENETATSTTTHMGLLAYDTWMYVTVKVDPVANTFEVWLDDTKLTLPDGTDKFGVKRRSAFDHLSYGQLYSKNYGTQPVYVDDLTYVEEAASSSVSDWQLF